MARVAFVKLPIVNLIGRTCMLKIHFELIYTCTDSGLRNGKKERDIFEYSKYIRGIFECSSVIQGYNFLFKSRNYECVILKDHY